MAAYAGFTIPDSSDTPDSEIQSGWYQGDIEIIMAGLQGVDCVLSGLAMTGGSDMTPDVAKGAVLTNGVLKAVAAASVTVSAADATNPRIDYVVVTSSGSLAVRAGTAAAAPVPPALTANDVVIAQIYVGANDTSIGSTQIKDRRVFRIQGPILIYKNTTPAGTNTTAAAVTVATVSLPSGLFLSGKIARLKAWGNYRSNSGTPTFTLTISYGGTSFFVDATGATTSDADRGAWELEAILIATGNATQSLGGRVIFQTPGAKDAPSTGAAGDLAVTTSVVSAFNFNAGAVDSDAANRIFLASWTMSASDAAHEIRVEGSTVELM